MAKTTKKPKRKAVPRKLTFRQRYGARHFALFIAAFIVIGLGVFAYTQAAVYPYDDAAQAKLPTDPAHGITYEGLRKVKSYALHPCRGAFEVVDVKVNDKVLCTHGADPTPPGVTTNAPESPSSKAKRNSAVPTYSAGSVAATSGAASGAIDFASLPITQPRCYGNGTFGRRVQLVYMYRGALSKSNQDFITVLMSTVLAGKLESFMIRSSFLNGASLRFIRFQHNANCQPTVRFVPLTNNEFGTKVDTAEYVKKAKAVGLTNRLRKYIIWTNYPTDVCGYATLYPDSKSSSTNDNNNNASYSLIGQACWFYSEPHELTHMLGGVLGGAPHDSGGFHCTDDHDVMCYNDNPNGLGTTTVNGRHVTIRCADPAGETLMDCGHDDYFDPRNVLPRGSFLLTHWNTANSGFLSK